MLGIHCHRTYFVWLTVVSVLCENEHIVGGSEASSGRVASFSKVYTCQPVLLGNKPGYSESILASVLCVIYIHVDACLMSR